MALTTLTPEELFAEISDLARDQGAATKDMWDELVEETVESHLSLGEIDLEEDTEGLKETLRSKWTIYKQASSIEGAEEDVKGELETHEKIDDALDKEEEEIF